MRITLAGSLGSVGLPEMATDVAFAYRTMHIPSILGMFLVKACTRTVIAGSLGELPPPPCVPRSALLPAVEAATDPFHKAKLLVCRRVTRVDIEILIGV